MGSADQHDRTGWTQPKPDHIPRPSFWPAGLALGIVVFVIAPAFEYVVSYLFVVSGLLLIAFSLRGWMAGIRDESRDRDD